MPDPIERIAEIHKEARRLYEEMLPSLGDEAFGYQILYGPPVAEAPVFVIGFNPGGPSDELPETRPNECWYAENNLGARVDRFRWALQTAFGADFFKPATGINALFLCAPNTSAYDRHRSAIQRFHDFSLASTKEIVRLLKPRNILITGFGTAKELGLKAGNVTGTSGRTLLQSATLEGCPALIMRHASGSMPPLNETELQEIGREVRARLH
jgi:hypothetical protein